MSDQNKITIGRIIEFFPNGNENALLPNNMTSAPAMVVQVFENSVNLAIFVANPNGPPVINAWSVNHKDYPLGDLTIGDTKGVYYWDWLPRV